MAETVHVYIRETSGNPQQFTHTAERRFGAKEAGGAAGSAPQRAGQPPAGRPRLAKPAGGRGDAPPQRKLPSRGSSAAASGTAAAGRRGEVPDYIKQRKAQLQHEKDTIAAEERARKAQDEIGAGKVRLSADQKAVVLQRLSEREAALREELAKMPMRFDTLRMTTRKNEIADELEAIEKTRPRFTREVVIVDRGSIAGVC